MIRIVFSNSMAPLVYLHKCFYVIFKVLEFNGHFRFEFFFKFLSIYFKTIQIFQKKLHTPQFFSNLKRPLFTKTLNFLPFYYQKFWLVTRYFGTTLIILNFFLFNIKKSLKNLLFYIQVIIFLANQKLISKFHNPYNNRTPLQTTFQTNT